MARAASTGRRTANSRAAEATAGTPAPRRRASLKLEVTGEVGDGVGCGPGMRRPPAAWIEAVLRAHNSRRAAHWVPPLIWNDACFNSASRQAEHCMEAGAPSHGFTETVDGPHGQSVRVLKPPMGLTPKAAEDIIASWYSEGSKYDFTNPAPHPRAAHFTQMLWSNTTSVGMAISRDGRFCVANYFPAGNKPAWKFSRCVRPLRDAPPPWEPAEVEQDGLPPCCAENWRKQEECEERVRQIMERHQMEVDMGIGGID